MFLRTVVHRLIFVSSRKPPMYQKGQALDKNRQDRAVALYISMGIDKVGMLVFLIC